MTNPIVEFAAGAALALAAWLIPRRVAGTRLAARPALLIDLAPVLLAALLLMIVSRRPIFSGLVLLSLGAGFALADQTKREAVREPVVFSDMSELPHVFTHPQLYLPFAGPGLVIGGAFAAFAFAVALLCLETPLWPADPLAALFVTLFAGAAVWALSREPGLGLAAATLRRLGAIGEPFADAARLGPFASLLVYGIIARAERTIRRARHAVLPTPAVITAAPAVPLVLVQCESFFDARRLSPSVPADLLPGFDACRRAGATYGRLDVAGWGANTMRAEFAVLTGISDNGLGYDRFNPYHAFARAPLASLARRLRAEGYRTLCLHPFDRGFFRRDLTIPALGFEQFLDRQTLGGSSRPPYCSDPDLAHQVLRVLGETGPRSFIFVITMGNHGPWRETGPEIDPALRRRFDAANVPQGGALLRYLDGLARSDAMLQILLDGLGSHRPECLLGFYGDHVPSLPQAFRHFGFDEWASDYLLLDGVMRPAQRLDLPAYRLPQLILDRLHQRGAIGGRAQLALGAA
ncbi:MAG: LTA synthase family protein [Stellaceae bacterium]